MMSLAENWCDADAVRQVLAGDANAFARLVERYQQRVYRFIRHQVPRADVVEDLTQETFLQAYRVLDSFRSESQFSTWLLGIARHIVLNFVNREWQPTEEIEAEAPDAGMDPALLWERDKALARLEREIAALNGELRDCLVLVTLEGLDYAEASEMLDVPSGTVKSRLNRARAALKDRLGEDFFSSILCADGTFP